MITSLLVTATGVIAAPVLVPFAITTIGFTATGITASSTAAAIMSSYGGFVTTGSACAVMQSIGAAGLGITGTVLSSATGGALGYVGSLLAGL